MDEQDIPIDINTNKLLEWLNSRRHINKDWQNNILKIREKINNAIQDMPAHDGILKLISGQHINYFHCLKIVEILKETEVDTKNLFGRYGSQRMKDWQEIVSSYQKDNLYLAEAAQMLVRNVTYEIPSLKKQISKLEQNQAECEKKIKDYSKTESIILKEFNSSCEQLGISGKNLKPELLKLVGELPSLYENISDKIKIVQPAVKLYMEFNKYLSGKSCDSQVLTVLQYLVEHGNTTTYQYKYGQAPIQIIEVPNVHQSPNDNSNQDEINFGDNAEEIDFGDNAGEIDFGENGGDIDFGDNGGEIDFGINIESYDITSHDVANTNSSSSNGEDEFEIVTHDDLKTNFEESGIVVEQPGNNGGGVAMGEEALTILDNPVTQEQIINNLIELGAFLKMRIFEMSSDSNMLAVSQMQDAPTVLQMQTLESVTALNDCINVALSQLTNKKIQHLHNIKHSPKYIDILTANLTQKLSATEKLNANKLLLENKIKTLQKEVRSIEPVIKKLIDNSKQLQNEIEKDISVKYKGRIVNLIGSTNVM